MSDPKSTSQQGIIHGGPLARQSTFDLPEEKDDLAVIAGMDGGDAQNDPPEIPDITPQVLMLLGPLVEPNLRDGEGNLSLAALQAKGFKTFADFETFLANQAALNDHKSFRDPYQDLLKEDRSLPLLTLLFEQINPQWSRGSDSKKAALMALPQFQARLVEIDAEAFAKNFSQHAPGRKSLQKLIKHPSFLTADQKADLIKGIYSVAKDSKALSSWERHTVSSNINPYNYFNLGVSEKNLKNARIGTEFMLDSLGKDEARAKKIREELLNPAKSPSRTKHGGTSRQIPQNKVQRIRKIFQENRVKTGAIAQAQTQLAQLWLWAADDRIIQLWEGMSLAQSRDLQKKLLKGSEALLEQAGNIKTQGDFLKLVEDIQEFYEADLDLPADTQTILFAARKYQGDTLHERMTDLPPTLQGPVTGLYRLSQTWESSVGEMGQAIRLEEWDIKAKDPQLRKQVALMIQGLEQSKHGLWQGYKQHKFISRAASNVAELFNRGDIQDIEGAQITLNALMQQLSQVQHPDDLQAVQKELVEELASGGTLDQALKAAEMDGTEQVLGLAQTCAVMAGIAFLTRGISLAAEGTGAMARFAGLARSAQTTAGLSRFGQGAMMGAGIVIAENTLAVATGEARPGPESVRTWFKDITATAVAMGLSAGLLKLPFLAEPGQRNLAKALWARYTESGLKGLGHLAADTGVEIIEELTDQYLRQRVLEGDGSPLTEAELTEITLLCFAMGPVKMGILAEHLRYAKSDLVRPSQETSLEKTNPSETSEPKETEKPAPSKQGRTYSKSENKSQTTPAPAKDHAGAPSKSNSSPIPWAAAAGLMAYLNPSITDAATLKNSAPSISDVGTSMINQGFWPGLLTALGVGVLGMAGKFRGDGKAKVFADLAAQASDPIYMDDFGELIQRIESSSLAPEQKLILYASVYTNPGFEGDRIDLDMAVSALMFNEGMDAAFLKEIYNSYPEKIAERKYLMWRYGENLINSKLEDPNHPVAYVGEVTPNFDLETTEGTIHESILQVLENKFSGDLNPIFSQVSSLKVPVWQKQELFEILRRHPQIQNHWDQLTRAVFESDLNADQKNDFLLDLCEDPNFTGDFQGLAEYINQIGHNGNLLVIERITTNPNLKKFDWILAELREIMDPDPEIGLMVEEALGNIGAHPNFKGDFDQLVQWIMDPWRGTPHANRSHVYWGDPVQKILALKKIASNPNFDGDPEALLQTLLTWYAPERLALTEGNVVRIDAEEEIDQAIEGLFANPRFFPNFEGLLERLFWDREGFKATRQLYGSLHALQEGRSQDFLLAIHHLAKIDGFRGINVPFLAKFMAQVATRHSQDRGHWEAVMDGIIGCFSHPNPEVRKGFVMAAPAVLFSSRVSPEIQSAFESGLKSALKDPDPVVRQTAQLALERMSSPKENQRDENTAPNAGTGNLHAFIGPALPVLETLLQGQPSFTGFLLAGLTLGASSFLGAMSFHGDDKKPTNKLKKRRAEKLELSGDSPSSISEKVQTMAREQVLSRVSSHVHRDALLSPKENIFAYDFSWNVAKVTGNPRHRSMKVGLRVHVKPDQNCLELEVDSQAALREALRQTRDPQLQGFYTGLLALNGLNLTTSRAPGPRTGLPEQTVPGLPQGSSKGWTPQTQKPELLPKLDPAIHQSNLTFLTSPNQPAKSTMMWLRGDRLVRGNYQIGTLTLDEGGRIVGSDIRKADYRSPKRTHYRRGISGRGTPVEVVLLGKEVVSFHTKQDLTPNQEAALLELQMSPDRQARLRHLDPYGLAMTQKKGLGPLAFDLYGLLENMAKDNLSERQEIPVALVRDNGVLRAVLPMPPEHTLDFRFWKDMSQLPRVGTLTLNAQANGKALDPDGLFLKNFTWELSPELETNQEFHQLMKYLHTRLQRNLEIQPLGPGEYSKIKYHSDFYEDLNAPTNSKGDDIARPPQKLTSPAPIFRLEHPEGGMALIQPSSDPTWLVEAVLEPTAPNEAWRILLGKYPGKSQKLMAFCQEKPPLKKNDGVRIGAIGGSGRARPKGVPVVTKKMMHDFLNGIDRLDSPETFQKIDSFFSKIKRNPNAMESAFKHLRKFFDDHSEIISDRALLSYQMGLKYLNEGSALVNKEANALQRFMDRNLSEDFIAEQARNFFLTLIPKFGRGTDAVYEQEKELRKIDPELAGALMERFEFQDPRVHAAARYWLKLGIRDRNKVYFENYQRLLNFIEAGHPSLNQDAQILRENFKPPEWFYEDGFTKEEIAEYQKPIVEAYATLTQKLTLDDIAKTKKEFRDMIGLLGLDFLPETNKKILIDALVNKNFDKLYQLGLWPEVLKGDWIREAGLLEADQEALLDLMVPKGKTSKGRQAWNTLMNYIINLAPHNPYYEQTSKDSGSLFPRSIPREAYPKLLILRGILAGGGKRRDVIRALRLLNQIPGEMGDDICREISQKIDSWEKNATSQVPSRANRVKREVLTALRRYLVDRLKADQNYQTITHGWEKNEALIEGLMKTGLFNLFTRAATFLNDTGLHSLAQLLDELDGSKIQSDGRVQYTQRYKELEDMGFDTGFVEQWSQDSVYPIEPNNKPFDPKSTKRAVMDQAVFQIQTHRNAIRRKDKNLTKNYQNLLESIDHFVEKLQTGSVDTAQLDILIEELSGDHEGLPQKVWVDFKEIRIDLKNLKNSLESSLPLVQGEHSLEITGGVEAILWAGTAPVETCQRLTSDSGHNADGQPIHRALHGQIKLVNYRIGRDISARRMIEVTRDSQGKPVLLVHRSYQDGKFIQSKRMREEILRYAKKLGIDASRVFFAEDGHQEVPKPLPTENIIYRDDW